jgi:hypothetical protein
MEMRTKQAGGTLAIAELKEFASFDEEAQRYIRRSLDIAFVRADALTLWPRNQLELVSIRAQASVYKRLHDIRRTIPVDPGLDQLEPFLAPLVRVTSFDLGQGQLNSFAAYRFLYERLIGATARPWLPAAFCAAAALPNLNPQKRAMLLQSISEAAVTAAGWSPSEPVVYPEWVDES